MRSRSGSRDRRYVRERDAGYRDRNRDGRRHDPRDRDPYVSRRSVSRSRSRSRDRAKYSNRDAPRDGNRELREVKRILSTVDNSSRLKERSRLPEKEISRGGVRETENKKKSYDEFATSERSKNDDDFKAKRGRFGEPDTALSAAKENDGSATDNAVLGTETSDASKDKDDSYDEAALKEIEKFLASTSNGREAEGVQVAAEDNKKGVDSDTDSETPLLWEDEEEKARREALEAEERRKKRQEIASKYASASVPTSPVGAKLSAFSPQGRQRAQTVPDTPKSEVAVVDVSTLSADASHGGSSISMPTTMHLAKLDLGDADEEGDGPARSTGNGSNMYQLPITGSAVAAAVRAVLPPLDVKADTGNTPQSSNAAAVITAQDAEGRQLEAEKTALELEERREQRGAAKGYGGGYGAGGRVEFDMFSSSPSMIEQQGRKGYLNANGKYADTGVSGRRALREALLDGEGAGRVAEGEDPHLQSNWDDGEGYYKARIGELVGDRFQILGVVGKGVFATVLKCVDLRAGDGTNTVAVKMIRNNDTMRKAAEKEKSILLSIAEHDPDNKKFCVRLLTHLEYRNHVALVFEFQSMNLRETLKRYGKDVGINIGAVRMYGRQLFVALKHLMDLRVVHADIKLDNILCSADLKQVKLCDFGSAFRETDTDTDPTPYLVSRFYRAPEIILGMQYDRAIDLWSVCTSLYELFTGHVMFPGRTNNEMLRLMMAVKGRFPNKLVKTHMRSYEVLALEPHFDPDLRFRQYEADPITGKTILRLIDVTNPTRDLAAVLRSSKAGADDMKLVSAFTDLLEKGLTLDPAKRMTVVEAFRHPFLSSKQ